MKAKLVKESLDDEKIQNSRYFSDERKNELREFSKKYPQIRSLAKQLEKKLAIKLTESDEDFPDELALDENDKEIACLIFLVEDERLKFHNNEEGGIALILDEQNGFQFYDGSQPLMTSAHVKLGRGRSMYQSLIPDHINVKYLTKSIYDEMIEDIESEDQD